MPTLVAVTNAVTWPAPLVIPVAGVRTIVFPVSEVTLSVTPGSAVPAESLTLKVSVVEAPNARELLPLTVMVEPVTSTLLDAVAESAVALTVIVRFDLLAPILSLAVTRPFASDTPLALMLLMNAVASVPVENVTVLPATACLVAFKTTAVMSTGVAPEEGVWGVLASS